LIANSEDIVKLLVLPAFASMHQPKTIIGMAINIGDISTTLSSLDFVLSKAQSQKYITIN